MITILNNVSHFLHVRYMKKGVQIMREVEVDVQNYARGKSRCTKLGERRSRCTNLCER